jgi:hypothetical protein
MGKVVLPEQILAVIVAVGCTHDHMDVLAGRLLGVNGEAAQICGLLVIKLDQENRQRYAQGR